MHVATIYIYIYIYFPKFAAPGLRDFNPYSPCIKERWREWRKEGRERIDKLKRQIYFIDDSLSLRTRYTFCLSTTTDTAFPFKSYFLKSERFFLFSRREARLSPIIFNGSRLGNDVTSFLLDFPSLGKAGQVRMPWKKRDPRNGNDFFPPLLDFYPAKFINLCNRWRRRGFVHDTDENDRRGGWRGEI